MPQTRWWMCVPPTETLPGHQLTWALIMCVLVLMKPNVSRKATKKRKCGSLPVSTMPSWYALATLPTTSMRGTLWDGPDQLAGLAGVRPALAAADVRARAADQLVAARRADEDVVATAADQR